MAADTGPALSATANRAIKDHLVRIPIQSNAINIVSYYILVKKVSQLESLVIKAAGAYHSLRKRLARIYMKTSRSLFTMPG